MGSLAEGSAAVRFPRAEGAGVALHVTQRSRARFACFGSARDRRAYLGWLALCAAHECCALHAYALLDNHAHLLVTPARAGGVQRMMRALNARYAEHLREEDGLALGECANWEERFDAEPVLARRHLFACMRYIENNPVRARLARRPGEWPWSSYRANALGARDARLTPHPLYYALGRDPAARQAAYRASFARYAR
jgi:putative transposase